MKASINKDRLLKIIKEEVKKHDKDLTRKLSMYTAKLNKLKKERSQKYLVEDQDSPETLGEIRMIEKVLNDLNSILYNE